MTTPLLGSTIQIVRFGIEFGFGALILGFWVQVVGGYFILQAMSYPFGWQLW